MGRRTGTALIAVLIALVAAPALGSTAVAAAPLTSKPTSPPFVERISRAALADDDTANGAAANLTTSDRPSLDPGQRWDDAVQRAADGRRVPGPAESSGLAAAADAAAVQVVPDTDLHRGQVVEVTGTGLTVPTVVLLQCAATVELAYECDLSQLEFLTPDATGAVAGALTLRRSVPGTGGPVDCGVAAGACEVVAADGEANILARHPLAFDPDDPLPDSRITVSPDTGLLHNESVTAEFTGFFPNNLVAVRQCVVSGPCLGWTVVSADGSGSGSTRLTVRLRVVDGTGATTTCLAVACEIRGESFADPDFSARAPITFDPDQPLPPTPTISVDPPTGLLHNQTVTVRGSGFDPSMYVQLSQCPDTVGSYCGDYLGSTQTGPDGRFSTTAAVSRLVSAETEDSVTTADCAEVTCWLTATAYDDSDEYEITARAELDFDASVPPPAPPTASATPDIDLPYRATVTVRGAGFVGGSYVSGEFCQVEPEFSGCANTYGSGLADPDGTVEFTMTVKRRFTSWDDEVVDCTDPGVTCAVVLYGQRSFERAQVPVAFDPDAPIPPPPSAGLFPPGPYGWRQNVGVLGSGFTPGFTTIQQCATVEEGGFSGTLCFSWTETEVNPEGWLLASVPIRRVFPLGSEPIDCAATTTACALRIGFGDPDETATLPLEFDPNSMPPPPPVLSLDTGGPLWDGKVVTLHGSGWTPGALVGITECRADAQSIADRCAITDVFTATADDHGSFAVPYRPIGATGTSEGPLDCTTGPGACVLAAANATDREEFSTLPLTFDAPELAVRSTTVVEGTQSGHDHHVGSATMPPLDPDSDMWTEAHVRVSLSAPIGSPTTVEWHTMAGSADVTDFLARHGRVTIHPGETSAVIVAGVMPDSIHEPTERFSVEIGGAPGTRIVDGSASVRIRDDDHHPMVSARNGKGVEGRAAMRAWVLLSNPSQETVTVRWRTRGGTARAGDDYEGTRGVLTFHPGETKHRVRVPLVDDDRRERTEHFSVVLTGADGGALGTDVATVALHDDD